MARPDWRPSADWRTLEARALLRRELRRFFEQRGLVEIDPPAIARGVVPENHIRHLQTTSGDYLTDSPEAALKRVVAMGAGDVYALGHVFRDGEVGRWHNPEFTMAEWYRRGFAFDDIVAETEALLAQVLAVPAASRYRFTELFAAYIGLDPLRADTRELAAAAQYFDVAAAELVLGDDAAAWIDLLMSVVIQPDLGREAPAIVTHFPIGDGVLAKPADDGTTALRFEVYYQGVELANGAEESTDATLAERRMAGVNGHVARDERLLAAMAAGLPECSGVALGVDRLLALRLGATGIGSVMPFDWLRR